MSRRILYPISRLEKRRTLIYCKVHHTKEVVRIALEIQKMPEPTNLGELIPP